MSNHFCKDCGTDTFELKEYYMVKNNLWNKYGNGDAMLCVGCLEHRMGRQLNFRDFTNAPVNSGFFPMSARLEQRLFGYGLFGHI